MNRAQRMSKNTIYRRILALKLNQITTERVKSEVCCSKLDFSFLEALLQAMTAAYSNKLKNTNAMQLESQTLRATI